MRGGVNQASLLGLKTNFIHKVSYRTRQHYNFWNNWKNTVLKKISKKVNTKGKKVTQSRCFPQWNHITLSLPISSLFRCSFVWEHDGSNASGKRKTVIYQQESNHTAATPQSSSQMQSNIWKTVSFLGRNFRIQNRSSSLWGCTPPTVRNPVYVSRTVWVQTESYQKVVSVAKPFNY